MERKHGSLIEALSRTSNHEPRTTPIFTTLRSGLGTLVDRLTAAIPPHWLRLNTTVTAIHPSDNGADAPPWTLHSRTGRHFASDTFDAVFLATPLNAARQLLAPLDATAAELLPTESSSAVLVAFCYADASRVPLPPGFGFLVPPNHAHPDRALDPSASLLLACTFADQKFPHRVPSGGRLVRAFFGGAAADRLARCNNDEIAAIARLELARALHGAAPISAPAPSPAPPPVLTVVRRWPASLPQYAVGHLDRVAEIDARLRALPGLTLLGNALRGVGLPDLIRDARQAARAAAKGN
jgi:oxygen-dependent protoporphyrinogen oxidase